MFLGGIHFREFLSTFQEWHSLILGLCDILCPFPSKYKMSESLKEQVEGEYHYYQVGRVLGIILWIVIAWIVKERFF